MEPKFASIREWLIQNENKLVWAGIAAFVGLISILTAVKYAYFGYNAIDLAYFNQVFWNTIHGRPFAQSIHPHLSLGDHAELAILPLSLLYSLKPDPRTLLFLQAVALALPAWPLYLIAKNRLAKDVTGVTKFAPLAVAFLWLANPLVHNVAFFEFHVLPFAIAPLLFAMLAYERQRKAPFVAWIVLALLCREDVPLVVACIGILAAVEKRTLWWRLVPFAIGGAWFLGAMKLVGHYAVGGGYKFAIYYSWLGTTPISMVTNALLHPLRVVSHLMTIGNVEMFVGFFLSLAFVPLLRPRRLLLAAVVLVQILLGGTGGGELILDTHYSSLFLPAIFLALIESLPHVPAALRRILPFNPREAVAAAVLVIGLSATYGAIVLGPLPHAIRLAADPGDRSAYAALAEEALSAIPADAPVATSYALLPRLSSRERLYSLHYLFLGVTQFGAAPYPVPYDLRYSLLDLDDLSAYRATFPTTFWSAPQYAGGFERLNAAMGTPIRYRGPFVTYEKDGNPMTIAEPLTGTPSVMGEVTLERSGAEFNGRDVIVAAEWRTDGVDTGSYAVRVKVKDADGKVRAETAFPLDAVPPASRLVAIGLKRTYAVLPADGLPDGRYATEISLEKATYRLNVDGVRGTVLVRQGDAEVAGIKTLPPFTIGVPR